MKDTLWGVVVKTLNTEEILQTDCKSLIDGYLDNNYDKMEIEELTNIDCDCGSKLINDICYQGENQTKWIWHYTCPHCYKQKLEFLREASKKEIEIKFNLK